MPFPRYSTAAQKLPTTLLCSLPWALQTKPSLLKLRAHLLPLTALQWISKRHCVWQLPRRRWGSRRTAIILLGFLVFFAFLFFCNCNCKGTVLHYYIVNSPNPLMFLLFVHEHLVFDGFPHREINKGLLQDIHSILKWDVKRAFYMHSWTLEESHLKNRLVPFKPLRTTVLPLTPIGICPCLWQSLGAKLISPVNFAIFSFGLHVPLTANPLCTS